MTLICKPCDISKITSQFGKDILKGKERWHNGIDIGIPIGTPIYAVADGTVKVVKNDQNGYGLYIVVDHGKYGSLYAHLSKFNCKIGQSIKAGDLIAYSGNSGSSTGPHLHFEIRDCSYSRFWERENERYIHAINPIPLFDNKTDKEKVQEHFNFDNNTMAFLDKHPYKEALYKKLIKDIK